MSIGWLHKIRTIDRESVYQIVGKKIAAANATLNVKLRGILLCINV